MEGERKRQKMKRRTEGGEKWKAKVRRVTVGMIVKEKRKTEKERKHRQK